MWLINRIALLIFFPLAFIVLLLITIINVKFVIVYLS